MVPLDSLTPYPQNPRQIDDRAVESVAASIDQFGFRQPIVVDSEGVIIIGHVRRLAALQLGLDQVPVHVAEGLTDSEVNALRLMDNKTNELTNWDWEELQGELDALAEHDLDLSLWFSGDDLIPDDPAGFRDAMDVLARETSRVDITDDTPDLGSREARELVIIGGGAAGNIA